MPPLDSQSTRDTTDEHSSHEPTMEEILASIRRIIADDQSLTAHRLQPAFENLVETADSAVGSEQASPPRKPEALPQAEPEIVAAQRPLLDDAKRPFRREPKTQPIPAAAPRVAASFPSRQEEAPEPRASLDPFVTQSSLPSSSVASNLPSDHMEKESKAVAEEPLISPKTDAAVATSFNALFASKLLPDRQTIAEMTRDLLRPMLRAWLDDNLPVMVERLVRAEIERVARGGQ
jgi:cell pole-organizing protein PopZ